MKDFIDDSIDALEDILVKHHNLNTRHLSYYALKDYQRTNQVLLSVINDMKKKNNRQDINVISDYKREEI